LRPASPLADRQVWREASPAHRRPWVADGVAGWSYASTVRPSILARCPVHRQTLGKLYTRSAHHFSNYDVQKQTNKGVRHYLRHRNCGGRKRAKNPRPTLAAHNATILAPKNGPHKRRPQWLAVRNGWFICLLWRRGVARDELENDQRVHGCSCNI